MKVTPLFESNVVEMTTELIEATEPFNQLVEKLFERALIERWDPHHLYCILSQALELPYTATVMRLAELHDMKKKRKRENNTRPRYTAAFYKRYGKLELEQEQEQEQEQ